MPANILVVVVDGLRASALGAYGNTTFSTPSLDQFAAESLLFDWCYAGSPELSAKSGDSREEMKPYPSMLSAGGNRSTAC